MATFSDVNGNPILDDEGKPLSYSTAGTPAQDYNFLKTKGVPDAKIQMFLQDTHQITPEDFSSLSKPIAQGQNQAPEALKYENNPNPSLLDRLKYGFSDNPKEKSDDTAYYLKTLASGALPPIAPFLMGNKKYLDQAKAAGKDLPGDIADMPSGIAPNLLSAGGAALGTMTGPAAIVTAPAGAIGGTYAGYGLNHVIGKLLGEASGDYHPTPSQNTEALTSGVLAGIPGAQATGKSIASASKGYALDRLVDLLGINKSQMVKDDIAPMLSAAGKDSPELLDILTKDSRKKIAEKAAMNLPLGKKYESSLVGRILNMRNSYNEADKGGEPVFKDELENALKGLTQNESEKGVTSQNTTPAEALDALMKRKENIFSTDATKETGYKLFRKPETDAVTDRLKLSGATLPPVEGKVSWIPPEKMRYIKGNAYNGTEDETGTAMAKALNALYQSKKTPAQGAADEEFKFLTPLFEGAANKTQKAQPEKLASFMDKLMLMHPTSAKLAVADMIGKKAISSPMKRSLAQKVITTANAPKQSLSELMKMLMGQHLISQGIGGQNER